MAVVIILFVVACIATIAAWVLYARIKVNEPELDASSYFYLGFAILGTFITYGFFVVAILEAKREVKTSVPAKVELVITEKQESGTVNQIDTTYVYKFQYRNI